MTVNNSLTKNELLLKKGYNLTPAPRGYKLHVKASFLLPQVGGVPHLPGVPHHHVNRPLVEVPSTNYADIYGLETVVSVLFSNTRTRLLYNEREIFNTARSEAECSIENSEFIVQ